MRRLVLFSLLVLAACGSSSGTSTPDAGVSTFTVPFGPVQVGADVEKTQCIVVSAGNVSPVKVGRIRNQLGQGVLQVVLYKVPDTVAQPVPFDCDPLASIGSQPTWTALAISQKQDDTIVLPAGAGMSLGAGQMVRLEVHYRNDTTQTLPIQITSTLTTFPDSQFQNEASVLLVGTTDTDISIPAMGQGTLGPTFFKLPSKYGGAQFSSLVGNQHKFGTRLQIWSATSAVDPGSALYSNVDPLDPVVATFTPPFSLPAQGGFKLQCDWFNSSNATVVGGPGAQNEVCFFVAYYFPSQGSATCLITSDPSAVAVCVP